MCEYWKQWWGLEATKHVHVCVVEVASFPGLGMRLPNSYDGGEREVTYLTGCVVARMLPLKVSILLPIAVTVRI